MSRIVKRNDIYNYKILESKDGKFTVKGPPTMTLGTSFRFGGNTRQFTNRKSADTFFNKRMKDLKAFDKKLAAKIKKSKARRY